MNDTHEWETFDEEEGSFRFAVCIHCNAYLSQSYTSGKKDITLDGVQVSEECRNAPPDEDDPEWLDMFAPSWFDADFEDEQS